MGSLIGHVGPGLGFILLGLWHLFNHIKLHSQSPKSYTSRLWFPTRWAKHLELYLIMLASTLSISVELFISPRLHHPLDTDLTIPSSHLHTVEHASISAAFFLYAALTLTLEGLHPAPPAAYVLTNLLAASAFGQELLLFRLHATDHIGLEGHYHALLQIVIVVSLSTALLGVRLKESFSVNFVRSFSILFQGVWFVVMGYGLWVPTLVPKGCFIRSEDGRKVATCGDAGSLHRAKSLVNLLFSWSFIGLIVFVFFFYLAVLDAYGDTKFRYRSVEGSHERDDESDDKKGVVAETKSMEKGFMTIEMET